MWLTGIGHKNETLLTINEIFKGWTSILSQMYSNNPCAKNYKVVKIMGKRHIIIDMFLNSYPPSIILYYEISMHIMWSRGLWGVLELELKWYFPNKILFT